ncbi:hypothetical protein TNCV_398801 [Trichonephila clavipes]|uniref:Uncharacterized protein n=1 Tax=Trichonephila clavipes TaxID=2585209 RepID=A0A8X6VTV3_TRICX|nr:hypothetical protein TNCV_398801 [Trichonephila clavipes]
MAGCFQGVLQLRMISAKALGSQHSPIRLVVQISGGGYSTRPRLQLLLKFTQHMLFKFRCPLTPGTSCVVPSTDKRTVFTETPMQAFESFSVRQASGRKPFPVQSPGLQGIPIRNALNEMDIGNFLISVAQACKTLMILWAT